MVKETETCVMTIDLVDQDEGHVRYIHFQNMKKKKKKKKEEEKTMRVGSFF